MGDELLPLNWKKVALKDTTEIIMGQSPPSETYNIEGKGYPFLQGKADFSERYPKPTKWCTKPLKVAEGGSILISVRAPVGDVNLADQNYIIGRGLCSIRFNKN
ncbi:MAG TPA: restriction endonuclease subunit S, partial [Methanothrix soehngenii]|nr:restriction endonuclease subunit S [Methanothrix soehngenii]